MMSQWKYKRGFTLLEILLVIAAIGILAAIVIIAINPNRQLAQARDAQRASEINSVYKSLEQFLLDEGQYPVPVESMSAGDAIEICAPGVDQVTCQSSGYLYLESDLSPTYLASLPRDPSVSTGSGSGYFVYRGENGGVSISAWNVEEDSSLVVGAASNVSNPAFSHYIAITITNSGSALGEQDILVTLDTEALILDGVIQNDCEDIAFARAPVYDSFSALPFVLSHGCDSVNTGFVVQARSIPSGTTEIYAHMGNGETVSLEDATSFSWMEYGNRNIDGNFWFDSIEEGVSLSVPFTSPRVVSQVMTYNGNQPVVSRIKDVTSSSFNLFMLEDDNDDSHTNEDVSWMAVEDGHWLAFDGVELQAGIHTTSNFHYGVSSSPEYNYNGDVINFTSSFDSDPSVFATLNTYNNGQFMTDVIHEIGPSSFRVEQERGEVPSLNVSSEDIAWVAFSRGEMDFGDVHYRFDHHIETESNGVENTPSTVSYNFSATPSVFAQGSTGNGLDGYWMRGADTSISNMQARFYTEEDTRNDTEQVHAEESFSWMVLAGDTTIPLAGYYDQTQISVSPQTVIQR